MYLGEDGITEMLMEGTADVTPRHMQVIDLKTGRSYQGRT
jgi:hypothetical protein